MYFTLKTPFPFTVALVKVHFNVGLFKSRSRPGVFYLFISLKTISCDSLRHSNYLLLLRLHLCQIVGPTAAPRFAQPRVWRSRWDVQLPFFTFQSVVHLATHSFRSAEETKRNVASSLSLHLLHWQEATQIYLVYFLKLLSFSPTAKSQQNA